MAVLQALRVYSEAFNIRTAISAVAAGQDPVRFGIGFYDQPFLCLYAPVDLLLGFIDDVFPRFLFRGIPGRKRDQDGAAAFRPIGIVSREIAADSDKGAYIFCNEVSQPVARDDVDPPEELSAFPGSSGRSNPVYALLQAVSFPFSSNTMI